MKNINKALKNLSEDISIDAANLQSRVDSITNFIKKSTKHQILNEYIGSYGHGTTIKLQDLHYDIDVALKTNISDEELFDLKKVIRNSLRDYKDKIKDSPSIRWRTYAVAIDFASDRNTGRQYHFDFTIYNKNEEVVKGKEDEILIMEKSGNIKLTNKIQKFDDSRKRAFQTSVKLIKHWNKNGKNKSIDVPSIVFTNSAINYFNENWDGTDNYSDIMLSIVSLILSKGINNYKLNFEPYDNPFDRETDNKKNEIHKKIEDFHNSIQKSINSTNSSDKFKILKEYFPGLKEPSDDTDPKDVKYNRSTSSQGA